MSLKFSVDVSGMDEVKRQLAMACGRAESVLAQQVMKRYHPICACAYRLSDAENAGGRQRGHLPRPIRPVPVLR